MENINARDILRMSRDQVQQFPSRFKLTFENGITIDATRNKTIYSNYFWDIIRVYPNLLFSSKYYVDSVLKGRPLTSDTHIKLLEVIYRDIIVQYQLKKPVEKELLLDLIYKVTNDVCNEVTELAESHVTSIDVLDFINATNHPAIKKIRDETVNTDKSIIECYQKTTKVLMEDSSLSDNRLVKAVKSGMVNVNQLLQCISIRGKFTEVDGFRLPNAIMTNYTLGLNSIYDIVGDSRPAAKSQFFQDSKIQDTEYAARRIQLLTMVVEKIDYFDCGTNQYLDWRISPPTLNDAGGIDYPGDLAFLEGKYFLNEETGTLDELTINHKHLIGKKIKIRSVIYCQHPDPHRVCEYCFGGLARNVSEYSNIGHLCAATMTQKSTQSVLSVRHIDFNIAGTSIVLNELTSKYFTVSENKIGYILKKDLKGLNPRIVVTQDEAPGLIDILSVEDMKTISPITMSGIEAIDIVHRDSVSKGELAINMNISQSGKKAIMTMDFLIYLKEKRWEIDSKGNFIFDVSDWDYSKPIFELPEVEFSFSDHSAMISRIIESNMKSLKERSKPGAVVKTLHELFHLVNSKIKVNIAALEIIIYAIMLKGPEQYAMGRNGKESVLGIAKSVIKNRSLGTAYGFQDVLRLITSPASFFQLDRPDSPFDVLIEPNEYLKHNQEKLKRYNRE